LRQNYWPLSALEGTVAQIDNLEHQPIYTVYLQYPAHVALPHPMLGLHGVSANGCSTRDKSPDSTG